MKLASLIPKSTFARNVSILTGGTVFAQGIALLALPVLTRLYSPQDFDLLAVYVALITLISSISCLRYNIAIPLPEAENDAMVLLVLSLVSGLCFGLIFALPAVFAPNATATLIGQPTLAPHLWLVPLGVMLASIYNALQYWASRKKRFGLVTQTRMTRAIGGVGTQLGFGFTNPAPFGLLLGHILYSGLGVIGLGRSILFNDQPAIRALDWDRVRRVSSEYRRFPVYSVPEALFNIGGMQIPILIISAVAVGPEAGFLMLAMRIMGAPMGLIGNSVAQVFIAEAPAKLRDGTLAAFTRRTMWTLFRTSAPLLVAIGVLSPILVPIFFGVEWARAGWLTAWITPWIMLQFVASPVSMVLHVIGRVGLALTVNVASFLLRLAFVLLAMELQPAFISEAYAISGTVFYIIYLLTIIWAVDTVDIKNAR